MTEHLIYSDNRLTVTARPTCVGTPQAQWIVNFVRRAPSGRKMLDQCAGWLPCFPGPQRWDRLRWHPMNSSLIPGPALAAVEHWLEGRPVEGKP